ncbi:MAG: hypothetical protein ACSHYB_01550 [Roseibacillus sp.]
MANSFPSNSTEGNRPSNPVSPRLLTETFLAGRATFNYGFSSQSLINRINLSRGGESFEQWSQYLFGNLDSQLDDADGDSTTNYEEHPAGTSPEDSSSRQSPRRNASAFFRTKSRS